MNHKNISKLEEFLSEIAVKLGILETNCKFNAPIECGTLYLDFRSKSQGKCNCINLKQLMVRPSKAHTIEVEGVMVGFDAEGYPWSDSMVGLSIDCTGLGWKSAIEKCVTCIKNNFKDLF